MDRFVGHVVQSYVNKVLRLCMLSIILWFISLRGGRSRAGVIIRRFFPDPPLRGRINTVVFCSNFQASVEVTLSLRLGLPLVYTLLLCKNSVIVNYADIIVNTQFLNNGRTTGEQRANHGANHELYVCVELL
jgi:hypothetical protein